jgi:hypothetical protein
MEGWTVAVLSVDLAYSLWSHLGIVVLDRMPPQHSPNPLRREDGHWREGFIVLPLPPVKPAALRWLH